MKTRLFSAIVFLALLPLLAAACTSQGSPNPAPVRPSNATPVPPSLNPAAPSVPVPVDPILELSREEAEMLMEELLRSDSTFVFDGIESTLRLAQIKDGPEPDSWTFIFVFQSRHAGYGDRTGQVLAQVITPHTAVIVFERGDIKSAIMDGKWDILDESEIQ